MELIYSVTSDPTVGQLQFLRNGQSVVWLRVNGEMSSFTQSDIDNGMSIICLFVCLDDLRGWHGRVVNSIKFKF